MANSLNNLAGLYYAQSQYAEAESPLRVGYLGKDLGSKQPRHSYLSQKTNAFLLQKMGRSEEAESLEARARAIRAKNSG